MNEQERQQAVFVTVFSAAVAVFYALSDVYRWPLFSYYPATGHLAWGWVPSTDNDGPAMYWYGWVATSLLLSALLGLVAARIAARVRLFSWHLSWCVPLIMVPVMAYTLKVYWR
jgi:hypothetical protein